MSNLILIVDDDPGIRDGLEMILKNEKYEVVTVDDGPTALCRLKELDVDLILADIAMPGMNGYQLLEKVRERSEWVHIPFIFLTARAMDSDVRFGKSLGVDDYLSKPVQTVDLLATIQGKLLRSRQLRRTLNRPGRTIGHSPDPSWRYFGRLAVDSASHQVRIEDERIPLSAREFRLLARLAEQPETVVSTTDLAWATHGEEAANSDPGNLIRPLIRSLRRKLGFKAGDMGCIENIRGVGYRLLPLS